MFLSKNIISPVKALELVAVLVMDVPPFTTFNPPAVTVAPPKSIFKPLVWMVIPSLMCTPPLNTVAPP